jgi:hypothetical protein
LISYGICTDNDVGVVTTLAGQYQGNTEVDGIGTNARFNPFAMLAIDSNQVIYVADTNAYLRRVTTNGMQEVRIFMLPLLLMGFL